MTGHRQQLVNISSSCPPKNIILATTRTAIKEAKLLLCHAVFCALKRCLDKPMLSARKCFPCAGLQSGEGRMMIDSVVRTQYINVTDTAKARHTDSPVAIANAVPTHCVGWQKAIARIICTNVSVAN